MSQNFGNLFQVLLAIFNRFPPLLNGKIQVDASVADAATATNQITQVQRLVEIRDFVNPIAKSATINISSAGDNTIISPSTATKSLKVCGLYFTAASAVVVTFKAGSTAFSGSMNLTDHAADYSCPLVFKPGQSFVINLGSAIAVAGYVLYWEV